MLQKGTMLFFYNCLSVQTQSCFWIKKLSRVVKRVPLLLLLGSISNNVRHHYEFHCTFYSSKIEKVQDMARRLVILYSKILSPFFFFVNVVWN